MAAGPVLFLTILFKVFAIIAPVDLIIARIVPLLKVGGLGLNPTRFVIFAEGSLSVLQSVLLNCGSAHISVLQRPLVWAASCICRRYDIMKTFREIV